MDFLVKLEMITIKSGLCIEVRYDEYREWTFSRYKR